MADRTLRSLAATALGALAATAVPLAVAAQTSQFYSPPKIVTMGTHASPVTGVGSVTVQVFVKKNGSIGAVKVQKTTNAGDNAAALEVAKSSKYKPGARDGKPIDAFYTLALKFNGSAVTSDAGAGASDLTQANALIRAGKYDDAKTHLNAYLTAHPGDKDAEVSLGAADSYLNDAAGAAAAFDAAGTIPDRFKVVAAKSYSDAAVDALKAKNNDQAAAYATKALAVQPNVNSLFIRGTAYANEQQYPKAIADFEQAKSMAQSGKADAATMNAIDSGLATAYIFGGQPDKGLALAQAVKQRDPSNTHIDDTLAAYYNQQATAAVAAGKRDQAVVNLESAAKAVPSRAAAFYVQAASVLSGAQPPDWKKVKAEADKALAVDPNNAQANFVAGIALANGGDKTGAIPLLQKAKANAGSDTKLVSDVDAALKQLGQKS